MSHEEMIAVITAHKEGKQIQARQIGSTNWVDIEDPSWNFVSVSYRIKPEPKYRPYANADECFAEIRKHGGWVRNKADKDCHLLQIVDLCKEVVTFGNTCETNYATLLKYDVWADDGSPCGILEE